MVRYSIYVGLNDRITHKQLFNTDKYIGVLKKVCKSYRVSFSFNIIQGGYMHSDGELEEETSLCITIFEQSEKTVNEIACDLCTIFNQECVMITQGEVKMYFINGDREVQNAGHIIKEI